MKKLNIAEILKDCPKGMELDCTMYENCTFDGIEDVGYINILVKTPNGQIKLSNEGCYIHSCSSAKCVIFPKGKTTWEGFQIPFKDGDIVTWEDRGSLVACIYKERKNTTTFNHHIALYKGGLGIVVNGEIALTDDELCFATEEEKQKLFKAIKDNGYKWNPETKTLEKLIEPKFKVGDRIKSKNIRTNYLNDNHIFTITEISRGRYWSNLLAIEYIENQDDWELVPNKFDITTLKPFDKMLVRKDKKWWADWFSHIDSYKNIYCISVGVVSVVIPYKGNEHLLGTTNDCDDYYKTWE